MRGLRMVWMAGAFLLGLALAQRISPQGILVNPNPTDLQVRVWVDKDPTGRGQPVYQIGEPISIYVNVNQDAYVYLFNINADGRIDPILPNPYDRNNFLRAGETRRFPPEGARYRYTVSGPEGLDRILAVASKRPLSLGEILDLERGQVKVQGAENLARALSIVIEPIPDRDWVSAVAAYLVARASAVPLPPGQATLFVDSSPQGAEVYLDGSFQGRTPLTLTPRPGRHEVEVRLSGYRPYRIAVNLSPGQEVRVFAELVPERRMGTLFVDSSPGGAEVYVEGQPRGRTPLRLTLEEGRYRVEVRLPGYAPHLAEVRVERDKETRLLATLRPLTGVLDLRVTPPSAQVYVDGAYRGQGPLRLELSPGAHDLLVTAPGFRDYRTTVEVRPGETRTLEVRLLPFQVTLELYTNVEARVFLNGEEVGLARGGYLRLLVPVGSHELTLVAPGYRTLVQEVRLERDLVLRFELKRL